MSTALKQSLKRAEEIFSETGILSRSTTREPTLDEREELWDITRVFLKRIYSLDLVEKKSKKEQDECNVLAHYCVVMLHWNDIYDPPHWATPAPQGRFRRDTIALALCIFTRISRNYSEYTKLKRGWIHPHRWGSFLMWVTLHMKVCNRDNIFHYFTDERIERITKGKYKKIGEFAAAANKGSIDARTNPDWYDNVSTEDPTYLVFWKLWQTLVKNTRKPYKFALNYIWMNEDMGGMALLSEDRDMNKSFLQKKVEKESFPHYWDLGCDVLYLMRWLTWEDEKLTDEESSAINSSLCSEFYLGDFTKKQNTPWDIVVNSRSILRDDEDVVNGFYVSELIKQDAENDTGPSPAERVGLVIENIRASVISWYNGDEEKTNKYLSFILKQLQHIAYADNELAANEYIFINEVQAVWGIDLKIWDEEEIRQMVWFEEEVGCTTSPEDNNLSEEPSEKVAVTSSEYLEDYPGDLYCKNERYDFGEYADSHPLTITPFANVFEGGDYKYEDLIRRFTKEEVDAIVEKIKQKKTVITLPFVREILAKKFDLRGLKTPFWFDPFIIHGSDNAGLLYFEQNGMMMNFIHKDQYGDDTLPTSINNVAHVDSISSLSVAGGYNGYFEGYLPDGADENTVSSLRMDWFNPNSGNSGTSNLIQAHGEKYASTLPIVEAIWEYGWKPVVEESKGGNSFFLNHTNWESFESWDELLEWANDSEEESGSASSSDVSDNTDSVTEK